MTTTDGLPSEVKKLLRDARDGVRQVRQRLPSYSTSDRTDLERVEDTLSKAQDRFAEALREAAEKGKVE